MQLKPLAFLLFIPVLFVAAVACQLATAGSNSPLPEPTATEDAASEAPRVIMESTRAPSLTPATNTPAPSATPTPKPDRNDCAAIFGTDYHSAQEREWYLANCLPTPTPTPEQPEPQPDGATSTEPGEEPTPVPAPAGPPAIPGPEVQGERWILVDIPTQTTHAMIGDQIIHSALSTTGKDDWETPVGTFYIGYRVENETMTGESIGAEENYVLEDVLYTQYFTNQGHALHLNYWRSDDYFGNIRSSHGCIGLRMADAEFFWNFANYGTRVTIQ